MVLDGYVACSAAALLHAMALSAWRSTHRALDKVEFVVLDTETTGLRPGSHRVIEVAGIRVRGGEVIGSFISLLNPATRLPNFIVQFTGITQEMVNSAPKAAEVMPGFLDFIEDAIIVGHNVGFDIGFLSYEARLLGLDFPLDGLDTIPLARRFLPRPAPFQARRGRYASQFPPRTATARWATRK